MKNYYELKQTTLMELEIEGLVAKIQRLEKENALKDQQIKQLKEELKPFLTEKEKRENFLKKRNEIDTKISEMFSKLHS